MHGFTRSFLCCSLLQVNLAFATSAADPGALSAALGEDTFLAGGAVELLEPVSGDALLAGGTVDSNASIGGDATVAGGQVAIRATVGDDLYVAGGQVEVDALVHGNVRIAGGRVRIAPESRLEGGVAIVGGTVNAQGRYGHYLTVAGGDVTVGGEIVGDVHVYAQRLTVLPGTRIDGELSYRASNELQLPADVVIGGGVVRDETQGGPPDGSTAWGPGDAAAGVGWLWVAGLFAIGLLLAIGFARFSRQTTAVLLDRPWLGLGVGFVALVCIPAGAVMLFVTLIGIPLAVIVLLLYLAMLIAAYVVGALYLGDRGLAAARPGMPATAGLRLLALFLALLALSLLSAVPLLGSLARLAVLLLGLGGIVLALWPGSRGGNPVPGQS